MPMVTTLKHMIIKELKGSIIRSLWKGYRLAECFCCIFNEMKVLHPLRWRRNLLLKASREIEGLIIRDCY